MADLEFRHGDELQILYLLIGKIRISGFRRDNKMLFHHQLCINVDLSNKKDLLKRYLTFYKKLVCKIYLLNSYFGRKKDCNEEGCNSLKEGH